MPSVVSSLHCRLGVLAALTGLLLACGGSQTSSPTAVTPGTAATDAPAEAAAPEPEAKPSFDLPALAQQAVDVIEAMASASTTAAGDCGVMATSLQALVDEHQGFFEQARAADQDPANTAELERLMQPFEPRLRAAAESMGSAVAPCAGDERMIKVMEGMPL